MEISQMQGFNAVTSLVTIMIRKKRLVIKELNLKLEVWWNDGIFSLENIEFLIFFSVLTLREALWFFF